MFIWNKCKLLLVVGGSVLGGGLVVVDCIVDDFVVICVVFVCVVCEPGYIYIKNNCFITQCKQADKIDIHVFIPKQSQ
jgi:hypothetical protein